MGQLAHQPLFNQPPNRLADRDAAHAQPLGQVTFDQARTRRQRAAADGSFESVGSFVAQRTLRHWL
jgi:hypothetical protein